MACDNINPPARQASVQDVIREEERGIRWPIMAAAYLKLAERGKSRSCRRSD
jgi:hypothetical protein